MLYSEQKKDESGEEKQIDPSVRVLVFVASDDVIMT